jgi:hypothetical protein
MALFFIGPLSWVVLQPNQRRSGPIYFHHLATLRVKDLGMALGVALAVYGAYQLIANFDEIKERFVSDPHFAAEVVGGGASGAGRRGLGHGRAAAETVPEGALLGSLGGAPRRAAGAGVRVPPPKVLEAFPGLMRVKPKTPLQGGGGLRARWKDKSGKIYEWDSRHGTLEKYDKRGRHLGEFDPSTGEQLKPPDPARMVKP